MLKNRFETDNKIEAGIDESGRGCLWGPLYAVAVIWRPEDEWDEECIEISSQIKDSKKLSKKKRAFLADAIKSLAVDYGVGIVSEKEIDEFGMTKSNRLAFTRAIDKLTVIPDRLLIDGILPIVLASDSNQTQETIVDGDDKYIPIAAASIIAKEAHDKYIEECVKNEPTLETVYSIGSSKGYGTLKHRSAIVKHGKHKKHRDLFLRNILGNKSDCMISDDNA